MRLVWLNFEDSYMLIDGPSILRHGDLSTVSKLAMRLGISHADLEIAITDMHTNKTNVADFGVNRTFMFATYNKVFDISNQLGKVN